MVGTSGPRISSRHNARFKDALALREGRRRREAGLVLVDGAREIGRALDAGLVLVEAWVALEGVASEEARAVLPRLAAGSGELVEATRELVARLAYGERDEGLVAVFTAPATDLARLELPERGLVAVLEAVEKPGNLGAVLRSADGAGVDAVIVADPVSDVWNPNSIRASLGTVFTLPLATAASAEAAAYLRDRELSIVATRVDAEREYDEVDYQGGTAVVLGSEQAGLSGAWAGPDVTAVRVPMLGRADSLNVAATAAVLFYEARRQRRKGERKA